MNSPLRQEDSMPELLSNFIGDLLKNLKIKEVLDPWMRNGSMLYKISKELKPQKFMDMK